MNKNLYVGNLSYKITDEDLKINFSEAGEVVSASIIKDKFSGQSRGFGFVEMKTEEGAAEAIKKFNGGTLDGKAITVNEARPKGNSVREIPEAVEIAAADSTEADVAAETAAADTKTIRNYKLIQKKQKIHQ